MALMLIWCRRISGCCGFVLGWGDVRRCKMLHLRKEIKSGYIYIYGNIYAIYIWNNNNEKNNEEKRVWNLKIRMWMRRWRKYSIWSRFSSSWILQTSAYLGTQNARKKRIEIIRVVMRPCWSFSCCFLKFFFICWFSFWDINIYLLNLKPPPSNVFAPARDCEIVAVRWNDCDASRAGGHDPSPALSGAPPVP